MVAVRKKFAKLNDMIILNDCCIFMTVNKITLSYSHRSSFRVTQSDNIWVGGGLTTANQMLLQYVKSLTFFMLL